MKDHLFKKGNTFGFKKGNKLWKLSGVTDKNRILSEKQVEVLRKNSFKKGVKPKNYGKGTFKKGHFPNNKFFKDTSIERKIEEELKKRNLNYQKQVRLCNVARVDFYLPEYRIVIQCDGNYWHNLPGRREKDERQDNILKFNGFNIYRFWGSEINKSVKDCIDKIKF